MCYNPQYAKSCVRVYNPNTQVVTATATTLTLGTAVVDTGCSLTLNPSNITVNKSGLYHLAADVTVNPTVDGTEVVQLYLNGQPIPSARAQDSAEAANITTIHVETDLCIDACRVNHPAITVVISGVAGSVLNLSTGVLKLA